MKPSATQFGTRENPASNSRHGSCFSPQSAHDRPHGPNEGATGGGVLERPGADQFLTVAELAIRLRVTKSWVYRHSESLGAIHLGKYVRFSWSRVLEILGGHP